MHPIIDNEYYYYSDAVGVITIVLESQIDEEYKFSGSNGSHYTFNKDDLGLIYETKDLALTAYYKKAENELFDCIENHQTKVDKYIRKLEKLKKQVQYLKDKYPEEFI